MAEYLPLESRVSTAVNPPSRADWYLTCSEQARSATAGEATANADVQRVALRALSWPCSQTRLEQKMLY